MNFVIAVVRSFWNITTRLYYTEFNLQMKVAVYEHNQICLSQIRIHDCIYLCLEFVIN
jgi:hypothetical protein